MVWYGSVDSVHDLAAQVGIHDSAPMKTLEYLQRRHVEEAQDSFPATLPLRHRTIQASGACHPNQQKEEASMDLKAVVKMRSTKTQEEIEELERCTVIGYKMHTTAMKLVRPGVTEKYVAGQVSGHCPLLRSHRQFPLQSAR